MDFNTPDFSAPLDTEERLAQMPQDWNIKGIFFLNICNNLRKAGIQSDLIIDYSPMKTYPCRNLIKLLAFYSEVVNPELSPRATLFELGTQVTRNFNNLPIGQAMISVSKRDISTALRRFQPIYNLLSTTSASIIDTNESSTIIRLENAWVFPTCFHLGTYRGAFQVLGYENVQISICEHSICNVDFKFEW